MKKLMQPVLKKHINNVKTLYHGTDMNISKLHDTNLQDIIFLSTDIHFSSDYGKVYKANVTLGKVFNSLYDKFIEEIYKEGFQLTDTWLNEEDDKEIVEYDWENDCYPSAKPFIDSPYSGSDSWNVIESTDGLIRWILNNYDSILITEGGSINYITRKTNIIEMSPL